jgi:hypothetical protein
MVLLCIRSLLPILSYVGKEEPMDPSSSRHLVIQKERICEDPDITWSYLSQFNVAQRDVCDAMHLHSKDRPLV